VAIYVHEDFSKTMFTPAGLDIYMRGPLSPERETDLQAIVDKLQTVPHEIGTLAKSGFIVGRAAS
jgi:hypothetical protein